MMRLAWIIVALTALASAVVHFRSRHEATRAQIHRLMGEQLKIRQKLPDQQLHLGELTAPEPSLWRAEKWPLQIVGPDGSVPDGATVVQRHQ